MCSIVHPEEDQAEQAHKAALEEYNKVSCCLCVSVTFVSLASILKLFGVIAHTFRSKAKSPMNPAHLPFSNKRTEQ